MPSILDTVLNNHHVSRRRALGALGAAALAVSARPTLARQDDTPATPRPAPPAPAWLQDTAGAYRHRVGDIEVTILGDGNGSMPPYPIFGSNAGKDAVEKALHDDFLPTDAATVAFNVPLIRTADALILIDTGNGPKSATAGRMLRHLTNLGVKPADITAVILTHLHGDHVGGLTDPSGALTFPNARYYLQKSEHRFWTGPAPDLSRSTLEEGWRKGMIATAANAANALKDRLELIGGPHEIVPGVRVEPAPGHTPGHQIVHIASADRELLMIADCVHHHCLSLRHPDWHLAFDYDSAQGATTRARTLDRAASDRTHVLSYHLPFPGLGHVRREGQGYQWMPTPWQW